MLKQNKIDVAFMDHPCQEEKFHHLRVFDYQMVCAANQNHPLSKKASVSLTELAKANMIINNQDENLLLHIDKQLSKYTLSTFEVNQFSAVENALNANLGVGFLPESLVKSNKMLTPLHIKGLGMNKQAHIAYHEQKLFSKGITLFLDFVNDYYKLKQPSIKKQVAALEATA